MKVIMGYQSFFSDYWVIIVGSVSLTILFLAVLWIILLIAKHNWLQEIESELPVIAQEKLEAKDVRIKEYIKELNMLNMEIVDLNIKLKSIDLVTNKIKRIITEG